MSAADVYTKEVHSQLERYATWLPTDNITVGAVGQLQGKIFVPLSHLKNFGISANVVRDPNTQATYKFMSSGAKEVAIDASASGVPTSAGVGAAKLNIAFSKAHSVYFSLAGCVGYAIDNLLDLGAKVLEQVRNQQWQLDYVVVTRVVTAGAATILQADSKNASIELEGNASGTPASAVLGDRPAAVREGVPPTNDAGAHRPYPQRLSYARHSSTASPHSADQSRLQPR